MTVCGECGRPSPAGSRFCATPDCGAYLGWDVPGAGPAAGPGPGSGAGPAAGPGAGPTWGPARAGGPGPGRAPGGAEAPGGAGAGGHVGGRGGAGSADRSASRPGTPASRQPAERATAPQQGERGVRLDLAGPPEEELAAGADLRIPATVTNTGTLVDEYLLGVQAPAGWVRVEPDRVQVYPGERAAVSVVLQVPADPAPPAGPLGYQLVVRSAVHPQVGAAASGVVVVAAADRVTAELAPVNAAGRGGGRARLRVRNAGNRPALVALGRADQEPGVTAQVAPPALQLAPGQAGEAVVRLRPAGRHWFGQPLRHPYRIGVAPEPGEPQTLDAAFVQQPVVPPWAVPAALLLIPLLVVGAVLLGRREPVPVVPAGAAATTVATPSATTTPASSPSTPTPTPTTSPSPSTPPRTATPTPLGPVTVPALAGTALAAATGRMRDLGLRVEREEEPSNEVRAGRVLRTDPAAGQSVDAGGTVTVTVSSGPTPRYDLLAAAAKAEWRSAAGPLPYGGADGDPRGYVLPRAPATLQDGSVVPSALETGPQPVEGGVVEGDFPLPTAVRAGDHLIVTPAIRAGATQGRVQFSVAALGEDGESRELWSVELAATDPVGPPVEVDLSTAEGAEALQLRVGTAGAAVEDWALWVDPHVEGRPVG